MTKRVSDEQILALVAEGFTNDELCARLGITTRTLTRWRVATPALSEAINTVRAQLTAAAQEVTRAHGTSRRYRLGCRCAVCTEANRVRCYESRMRRLARLGLPLPDGTRGRRRKETVAVPVVPTPSRSEQVQQAIARGWPVSRIVDELDVTYPEYRQIREQLDTAVAS